MSTNLFCPYCGKSLSIENNACCGEVGEGIDRVAQLEAEGLTTSDAQAAADAEMVDESRQKAAELMAEPLDILGIKDATVRRALFVVGARLHNLGQLSGIRQATALLLKK